MESDERYGILRAMKDSLDNDYFKKVFKETVLNDPDLIKDKVVLNIRPGSGWTCCFCALYGFCEKVYAVDESETVVQIVRGCSVENNLRDKIEVIQGSVSQIEIPEMVDVIVVEFSAADILLTNILDEIDAAKRFLKPDGFIIPESFQLFTTLVNLSSHFGFSDILGVNLCVVEDAYRRSVTKKLLSTDQFEVKSNSYKVTEIILNSDETLKGDFEIVNVAFDTGEVDGIKIWGSPRISDENIPVETLRHPQKGAVIVFPKRLELEESEPFAFKLTFNKTSSNYQVEFENVEPVEFDHPIGCPCFMTKCMVIAACMANPAFNNDLESDDEMISM